MKILFLIPYPLYESPSQRFRFEQYLEILSASGYRCSFQSFLDSQNWQLFFKSGNSIYKAFILARGFCRRFFILFKVSSFDFIFVHREATPLGPPIIEWIIAKVLRKKLIYDFDDAIWLTDRKNESFLLRNLKARWKVKAICRWSYKVSCGNSYLQHYAGLFNSAAIYNPTTIDTNLHRAEGLAAKGINYITIGWTGSHSTLKYLEDLEPVLKELEEKRKNIRILVIADKRPTMKLTSLEFIPWSKQTEVTDLLKIDIGIMPLPDDEWSKGKCGFKALQYMAIERPAIVSNVGANVQIVDQGLNGFLCTTHQEWMKALITLIDDEPLRLQMGRAGKKKVEDHYSVSSNADNFLALFT
jgi:glycosyltransferase involved in cell wall biosynthesis